MNNYIQNKKEHLLKISLKTRVKEIVEILKKILKWINTLHSLMKLI